MSITPNALIQPKFASITLTADYTSPSRVIIDKFTATNISGGAVSLTVNIVPPSGSPISGNRIISNRLIAPNETYVSNELAGHVLEANNAIWNVATASNALVLFASGRTVT